ncbi:MAG: hypothetical protein WD341_06190 [Tistlia sp.]|uniref:hypothetical protein n=1 Tax=Tistlia sp. TaxID=3057121 RepID=UPI0034A40D9D
MKSLSVSRRTVDLGTGEVTEGTAAFAILPPPPDACQVCGRRPAHPAAEPHDAGSLYYQYAFRAEHGRWPTWKDALAHCAEPVRAAWERALRARGAWSEPEGDANA